MQTYHCKNILQNGQIHNNEHKIEKESMDYQIKKLSQFYADKGSQIGESIQCALLKCGIDIIKETPLSIEFTPWTICDPRIDDNICGRVLWNPLNDFLNIQYSLHLPFSTNENTAFSRCLKWYLYKWNERRSEALKKLEINFLYPGADNAEILLLAKCKVSLHQIDRKIRMYLLQMNSIMEMEHDMIISILSGDPPAELKDEIFREVYYIISEMS